MLFLLTRLFYVLEYRRATTLPPEMLSRYLPKATNKDKDHEDEDWVGKDRFKHYPHVREVLMWGSGEFVKLVRAFRIILMFCSNTAGLF